MTHPHSPFLPRTVRMAGTVIALLLGLALPFLVVAGSATAQTATRPSGALATDGVGPVQVLMQSSSSPTITPDTRYWLQGLLRNSGSTPLTSVTVRLRVDWPVLDPAGMSAWESRRDDQGAGVIWLSQRLPEAVPARQQVQFRVEGPSSALGLPTTADAFGPRGMAVEVVGNAGSGTQRLAIQRSFLVWSPVADRTPTKLAILAPLTSSLTATRPATVPADPRGSIPDPVVDRWGATAGERWSYQWATGGRLRRIMTATADPAVSWAIDPALISAANAVASSGTTGSSTTGTSPGATSPAAGTPAAVGTRTKPQSGSSRAPGSPQATSVPSTSAQTAAQWTLDLAQAAQGREVFALPWGDPDLLALGRANARTLLSSAQNDAATVARNLFQREVDTSLLWPLDGEADLKTARLMNDTGGKTMLLDPALVKTAAEANQTANGTSAADADLVRGTVILPGAAGNKGLISDPALGEVIADLGSADPVVAQQRAVAAIAARSLTTDPTASPALVAALPRGWDPLHPESMNAGLTRVRSVPWIQLTQLSSVREEQPTAQLVGFASGGKNGALSTEDVTAVADDFGRLDRFRTVLTDPNVTYNPLRSTALSLVSTTWRRRDLTAAQRSAALGAARSPLATTVAGLSTAIKVETAYSGQLLSATGSLPVTVTNTLNEPVTVQLTLHPNSGQLIVGQPQKVTIDGATAGETARASVTMPVKAVANGEVEVTASLSAPGSNDTLIVAPEPIRLRVRPQWETRFFVAGGGALGLLLVAGLIRSMRRGRRSRIPSELVPDPDDEAVARPARSPRHAFSSDSLHHDSTDRQTREVVFNESRTIAPSADRAQSRPNEPTIEGRHLPSPFRSEEPMSPDEDRYAEPGVAVPPTRAIPAPNWVPPTRVIQMPLHSHLLESYGDDDWITHREVDPDPFAALGDRRDVALESMSLESSELISGADEPDPMESASVMRNSAVMTIGTLLSRILGMVRMVVLSAAIGAGGKLAADAFAVANTLPNQMYILIAGGVLNAVLVPQIVRAAKREDGGTDYIDRLVTLSVIILAITTIAITAASPLIIHVLGKRWDPATVALAVAFAYWCVPQMFFYGMYTIFGQILTARGSFAPYMWAPIMNNIVAIAGLAAYIGMVGGGERAPQEWTASQIALLAGTATAGVIAQTLMLIPALRRVGYRWHPRWGWRGIGLRAAGSVAMWVFAGVALAQLGFIGVITPVLTAAGKASSEQGIAAGRTVFDNAYAIFMLPHSLITVSLVTATFPRLSQQAADRDFPSITGNLSLALRTVAVATVFATAAGLVLATEATATMFQGTSLDSTNQYGLVTAALLLGVVPYSAQYLFQRVSFAFEDARTPFWIGLINTGIWAAGTYLASQVLPAQYVVVGCGVALALASLISVVAWVPVTKSRLGSIDGHRLFMSHARLGLAGLGAGVMGWLVKQGYYAQFGQTRFTMLVVLVVAGSVMLMTYLLLLRAMRVPELDALVNPFMRRFRRR